MAFNFALKDAITRTRKSQIVLAKRMRIHDTRLSKIVHGHVEATEEEKIAIAKVLKKTPDQLFGSEALESAESAQ